MLVCWWLGLLKDYGWLWLLIELLWLEAGFCVGCVGCLLAAFMAGKFVVCLIMLFID